jgi:hypothetical protein
LHHRQKFKSSTTAQITGNEVARPLIGLESYSHSFFLICTNVSYYQMRLCRIWSRNAENSSALFLCSKKRDQKSRLIRIDKNVSIFLTELFVRPGICSWCCCCSLVSRFFGVIWSHNNIAVKGEEKSVKQTAMLLLYINVVT